MSLALRFLPTLGMETKAIIDAQSARGGSVETGSFVVRIKAMVASSCRSSPQPSVTPTT